MSDIVEAMSPSLRGRGLKYENILVFYRQLPVALFARAWIEIMSSPSSHLYHIVALFARAWIEIDQVFTR